MKVTSMARILALVEDYAPPMSQAASRGANAPLADAVNARAR